MAKVKEQIKGRKTKAISYYINKNLFFTIFVLTLLAKWGVSIECQLRSANKKGSVKDISIIGY